MHHHQMIPAAGNHHNQHIGGTFMRPGVQDSDFPLRILVQSDMVGAIIGRAGSTIKQITQQSKARIDVHREDNSIDHHDKVITINGTPRNCSIACFKIVEIIQNEKSSSASSQQLSKSNSASNLAEDETHLQENHQQNEHHQENEQHDQQEPHSQQNQTNAIQTEENVSTNSSTTSTSSPPTDVQLRILAHNNLIGRLIGRNGASIKKIMEQTSTKINISANSLTDCTHERTITVVGDLEQVRQAEQIISAKLRTAYMSDVNVTLQAINQQSYLFNNVPGLPYLPGQPYTQNPILSTLVNSQTGHAGHHQVPRAKPAMGGHHQQHHHQPHHSHQSQITGSPLYPNSLSYLSLYPNISVPSPGHALLGFNSGAACGPEIEKETVNIYIPSSMVGAIIGKSGSAIKEMISTSGASIKVAAAPAQQDSPSKMTHASKDDGGSSSDLRQQTNSDQVDGPYSEEAPPESVDNSQSEDTIPDSAQCPQEPVTTTPQVASQKYHSNNNNHNSYRLDPYSSTRRVTIVGPPDSQWTAQYLIYRKVSIENGKSDISLMVEIQVPSQFVGKIIGKGGNTVKHLQKLTRTTIRLPDEKPSSTDSENDAETCVQITGEFQSTQLAQRQIRNLIRESLY